MAAVDFLVTPTVQRVLAATLTQPTKTFTLKDLLDRAGAGRGSAQQQIDRLVRSGVLKEEPRRGRQRSIGANPDHFLYPELRAIARKTFGLVDPIREALAAYVDRIEEAFIFGSVASEQDTGDSDIDLMIIGSVDPLDLFPVSTMLREMLGRKVHFNVYDHAEWLNLVKTDPVIKRIAASPRLKIISNESTS